MSSYVVSKIKKIFGIKSKKINSRPFNYGYSQGFSNSGFADKAKLFPYDKLSQTVRLYVISVEKAVVEHFKKKYNPAMARSKTRIEMSHYGIDRLAKKAEEYGGPKIAELEEEVKTMFEELGIPSPFKSLLELSCCADE